MKKRASIKMPLSAEVSSVSIARRAMRRAMVAIVATVRRTWPNTKQSDLIAAVKSTLDRGATIAALKRISLLVRYQNYLQLSAILTTPPVWDRKAENRKAAAEAIETWIYIKSMLVPVKRDSIRIDKLLPGEENIVETPYLNSIMGRLRAQRASNAEIIETLQAIREAAPEMERTSISKVRARVLGWEAKANQEHQEEVGVRRYTWVSQQDFLVRPRHAELDGTIQRWSAPPIADSRTGYRAHPGGCNYCRCVAEPIETKKTKAKLAKGRRARA